MAKRSAYELPLFAGLGYKSEQWGMGRLVVPSGKIDTRQGVL
jgi:hypothetical protein